MLLDSGLMADRPRALLQIFKQMRSYDSSSDGLSVAPKAQEQEQEFAFGKDADNDRHLCSLGILARVASSPSVASEEFGGRFVARDTADELAAEGFG